MRLIQSVVFILLVSIHANAQQPTIKVLESGKRVSIRGLSVVNDNIIWASGSAGSVARSTDGGNTFIWMKVPGYEKNDFRDIEAFDSNTAIIMGITTPAVILKTKDGGKNWKKVFEDTTKGAFFDAMDFFEEDGNMAKGILVGDPINDRLFNAWTIDGGETWEKSDALSDAGIKTVKDEAMFASSGTNVKWTKFNHDNWPPILLVTGGKKSSLKDISSDYKRIDDSLPIMQGLQSTGANSIDIFSKNRKAVIVGGDFSRDTIKSSNCVLISFGDKNYKISTPQTPPHGYRSCVIYLDEKNLLTCGTSGIDISKDGGNNWELISKESFHVCQKAKNGKAVFLAGSNGRIAKLIN